MVRPSEEQPRWRSSGKTSASRKPCMLGCQVWRMRCWPPTQNGPGSCHPSIANVLRFIPESSEEPKAGIGPAKGVKGTAAMICAVAGFEISWVRDAAATNGPACDPGAGEPSEWPGWTDSDLWTHVDEPDQAEPSEEDCRW